MPNAATPRFSTFAHEKITLFQFKFDSICRIKIHLMQFRIVNSKPLNIKIGKILMLISTSLLFGIQHFTQARICDIAQFCHQPVPVICNHIPKHLHKPRFDEEVKFLKARLGVLLQLANLIQLRRNPPLSGERMEWNILIQQIAKMSPILTIGYPWPKKMQCKCQIRRFKLRRFK